jgi:hypothetical protein
MSMQNALDVTLGVIHIVVGWMPKAIKFVPIETPESKTPKRENKEPQLTNR